MVTELQIQANRSNAERSTGPQTETGKAVARRNATRHGILTGRLLLEDENQTEFETLVADLQDSFNPTGAIELALVERIAVAVWRQRRLVSAETAELEIHQRPYAIAKDLGRFDDPAIRYEVSMEYLRPFDEDRRRWCETVLCEFEALEDFELENIQNTAPRIYEQLITEAEDDRETPEEFVASLENGIDGYLLELNSWCRKELAAAEARPEINALAERLRRKNLIVPLRQLEVFARYQTTLDNQLFKALRALREAQDWRPAREQTAANTAGQ